MAFALVDDWTPSADDDSDAVDISKFNGDLYCLAVSGDLGGGSVSVLEPDINGALKFIRDWQHGENTILLTAAGALMFRYIGNSLTIRLSASTAPDPHISLFHFGGIRQ